MLMELPLTGIEDYLRQIFNIDRFLLTDEELVSYLLAALDAMRNSSECNLIGLNKYNMFGFSSTQNMT